MDLVGVLAELHAELDRLDVAIASLQRLQQADQRRGAEGRSHKSGKTAARNESATEAAASHAGERTPSDIS